MNRIVLRYLDGKDKISLLGDVLRLSFFEDSLESVRRDSGKSKRDFSIVIKPNAMMYIRRDEDGVTTDALLVLALVEWLSVRGYGNIKLVESRNLYEAGFDKREPIRVMSALGLAGGYHWSEIQEETRLTAHMIDDTGHPHPYTLEDLSAHTVDVEAPDMPHGTLRLGKAWYEADYRISFCAFKTHIYDGYTLLVKNTYGCLPEGNKMWHYHYKTGASRPTIEQLKLCPVHFGIIDAITGADGQAGVKWDRAIPRKPGFIMAGANIGEVERWACSLMGAKYKRSYMSRPAIDMLAEDVERDGQPRPLGKWINVLPLFIALIPILERVYILHRCVQMLSDFFGSKPFKRKPAGVLFTVLGSVILIMPLLYALQKRHWVILFARESRERLHIRRKGFKTSRSVSKDLTRLNRNELEILGKIISRNVDLFPKIYGHRIMTESDLYPLPNSSYFNLERIRNICLALSESKPSEREDMLGNISARIAYKGRKGYE